MNVYNEKLKKRNLKKKKYKAKKTYTLDFKESKLVFRLPILFI